MIQTAVDFILDILFPRRCPWCGAVVGFSAGCPCDAPRDGAALPGMPLKSIDLAPWHLTDVYAVYRYEYPVRNALLRFKFEGEREQASLFGAAMLRHFQASGLKDRFDVVVPAPLSPHSLKKRGYNQSGLLALAVAQGTGLPCDEDLLKKVRETEAQRTLNREERLANVKDAYSAGKNAAGKRILLVDDIITTGSTVNECAAALLRGGALECSALCLAASMHSGQEETDSPPF